MTLRLGALAGVLGVVVQFVASAMHPGSVAPNDSAGAFAEYASSNIWTAVHLGQFLGVILVVLMFVALAVSLPRDGFGGVLALIGGTAAILVGAVFAVQMAVDGVALKGVIDTWSAAPPDQKASAFQVAEAVRDIEKGLSGLFHLLNGTAILTLGAAVASTRVFPRWLGWLGVVAGIGFMSGGVSTAHTGFSPESGQLLTPSLLVGLVFVIGTSVAMLRASRRRDVVPARTASVGAAVTA